MDDGYKRTIEDIVSVVGHAKLEVNDLRPLTQVLYFSDSFPEYRLLELDDELSKTILSGEKVVFKGNPEDKVVLCTEDTTYEVKEAETSNSLLLIPGLRFADELHTECGERRLEEKNILGVYKEYLEVRKCRPKVQRLRGLLEECPYKGNDVEDDEEDHLYNMEMLLDRVQASEKELREALKELDAVLINGKWRLLCQEYHFKALGYLLNLIEEMLWSWDSVPIGHVLKSLRDALPNDVVKHIVQTYLEPTGLTSDEDGDELFSLKVTKTCRFLGEYLLRSAGKFNLQDFLQAWQQSVPEGMTTDLSQLEGVALSSTDVNPHMIWYFPEYSLPEDLQERFTSLFSERERWSYSQIEPYIRRFAMEKQSVHSILTKFSRASTVNGVKYYTARHGK